MAQAAVTDAVVSSFVIQGGLPLSGRVRAAGNKNGALPILAACLLTSEPVVLHNVPRIRDAETMIALIADLGAEIEWTGVNEVRVQSGELASHELDAELASRIRASFLLAGPLLARLCRFLVSLGADIEGIESNVLRVRGVESLRGGEWRVGPEHIEVGSFIGLAAVTGGDVTIENVESKDVAAILPTFERLGVRVECAGSTVRIPPNQELVITDDLGGQIPKIEDGPWPAFPADLTSIAVIVATQARGTVLIFEKMFESRLFFVDKLVSMGARIILCDPHRAVVTGPAKLYGQQMSSPDIRAGMAMLLAALCAEGTSTIGNIGEIDRGYERIDERLRSLGARIERIEA